MTDDRVDDLDDDLAEDRQVEAAGGRRRGSAGTAGCERRLMSCYGLAVQKFLLLSILLTTFLLPALAARIRSPRRALGTLVGTMLLAEVAYAVFLYTVYPLL